MAVIGPGQYYFVLNGNHSSPSIPQFSLVKYPSTTDDLRGTPANCLLSFLREGHFSNLKINDVDDALERHPHLMGLDFYDMLVRHRPSIVLTLLT